MAACVGLLAACENVPTSVAQTGSNEVQFASTNSTDMSGSLS